MKLKKLVCIGFNGTELEDVHWEQIDKVVEKRELSSSNEEATTNHNDAEGFLVKLGAKINSEMINKFPNLKYIGMLGTGFGGIDTKHASKKGITVTNIADYATEGVAEFTFGILLEHLRKISVARTQAKNKNYSDEGFIGMEIKGKKFGIIGLGHIGRRISEIAKTFGCEVSYWSRNRRKDAEEKGIKYEELDNILSKSDVITLNLSYNSETLGIINKDKISLIKPNTTFINLSPMELLDFNTLTERLSKNDIIFMLDHSDELSQEQLNELEKYSNCIIYPPIAYLTTEAGKLKKDVYVNNLKNFLDGTPSNKVN